MLHSVSSSSSLMKVQAQIVAKLQSIGVWRIAEVGDQALIDIAGTLQEVLRADGLVARYGSDKFAVLLPPDPAMSIHVRLRDVAERARASVAAKTYHGVSLSARLGRLSFSNASVESAPDLVAIADDALARARQRGESEVEII